MLIVFNRESLQRFDKIIDWYWPKVSPGTSFTLERFFARHTFYEAKDYEEISGMLPAITKHMVSQQTDDVGHCKICYKNFILFTRRHYCRQCGHLVCGDCSTDREWLQTEDSVQIKIEQLVRICQACYASRRFELFSVINGLEIWYVHRIIFYYVLKLIYSHVLESNLYQAHQQTLLTALYIFQTSDLPDAYQTLWENMIVPIDAFQGNNTENNYAEPYQWLLLMPGRLSDQFITDYQDKLASIIKPLLAGYVRPEMEKVQWLLSGIARMRSTVDNQEAWTQVFDTAMQQVVSMPKTQDTDHLDREFCQAFESYKSIFETYVSLRLVADSWLLARRNGFHRSAEMLLTAITFKFNDDNEIILNIKQFIRDLLIKYTINGQEQKLTLLEEIIRVQITDATRNIWLHIFVGATDGIFEEIYSEVTSVNGVSVDFNKLDQRLCDCFSEITSCFIGFDDIDGLQNDFANAANQEGYGAYFPQSIKQRATLLAIAENVADEKEHAA